jgi:hypothetical protein
VSLSQPAAARKKKNNMQQAVVCTRHQSMLSLGRRVACSLPSSLLSSIPSLPPVFVLSESTPIFSSFSPPHHCVPSCSLPSSLFLSVWLWRARAFCFCVGVARCVCFLVAHIHAS